MMNSAVLDHTFGFEVSSRSTIETNHWPLVGEADGCSSKPSGGEIQGTLGDFPDFPLGGRSQETLGNLPDFTSAAKSLGKVCLKAFSNSGVPGLRKAVKYRRTSSVSARLGGLIGSSQSRRPG